MYQKRNFEQSARNRKMVAIFITAVLHIALFAAIAYPNEVAALIPDFIKDVFGDDSPSVPIAGAF